MSDLENNQDDEYKFIYYENVIHDIKTPMSIIYSNLQLLELSQNLSKEDIENIQSIKKNWYRIMKSITDVSDISKITKGSLLPNIRNCDIVFLVESIAKNIKSFADRKNINVNFKSNVSKKIIATDKDMLERILLNLLSNSIKFNKINGSIFITLKDYKNYIQIHIKDTGIGMDEKYVDLIFNRYITSDNKLGSGIGLSIVIELVRLLKGSIEIANTKVGVGTEFIITLPFKLLSDNKETDKLYDDFYNDNIVQIELSDDYY